MRNRERSGADHRERLGRLYDENDAGISGTPEHAVVVLEHIRDTDGLLFDRGDAGTPLRTVLALNRFAEIDGDDR